MKRLFTILLLCQMAQVGYGQTTRFGMQAGAHISIINTGSGYGFGLLDGGMFSYSAGILMDQRLTRNIIFQPELNWIHKGGKNTFFTYERYSINYVELPLKFLFRTGPHHGFFIGGGPNLSYGISGTLTTADHSSPIDFNGAWDHYGTPWELSVHLVTGYLTPSGWQFSLAFDISSVHSLISPLSPYENIYLGFRVGYLLTTKNAPKSTDSNHLTH